MGLVFKLVKQTPAALSTSASYAITASYAENGGVTRLIAGPNITLSPTNGKGEVIISASAGGSTTPGGSPTQIQYNNSGTSFGGVPTLTYNGTILAGTGSFSGSFFGNLTGTSSYALTASYIDGGTF